MAATRAPKQWYLSKTENVNSFENWKQNLIHTLSLHSGFPQFLVDGVRWGFQDDSEEIPEDHCRTGQQKINMLELMLGQIANYCPLIFRITIVKK